MHTENLKAIKNKLDIVYIWHKRLIFILFNYVKDIE